MTHATCAVESCATKPVTRGWCNKHYKRWQTHGDPLATKVIHGEPLTRFWSKVDKTETCWLWTGGLTGAGYASFGLNGKSVLGHRYSYETFAGPIPEGLQLDHLCRVRHCVNPSHLEPVTCQENLLRGETINAANAAKVACPQGHRYTEANTYVTPSGARDCRTCRARRVSAQRGDC